MSTNNKILASMSYFGFFCFVPLLLRNNSRFIEFHSRQGLVLWLWGIVALVLFPLPFGRILFMLSSLTIVAMSAIGLVSTATGKTFRLPVVFDLAEKFWPLAPSPREVQAERNFSGRKGT